MSVFTHPEREYLLGQSLGRLATASPDGIPDVSAVRYLLDGDTIVTRGLDLTKTIRYGHLVANPRAALVVDDLKSVDPWKPRGVKIRGQAVLEEDEGKLLIRIRPELVWSWGINMGAPKRFATIERRRVE